jgi:hypothetical protein
VEALAVPAIFRVPIMKLFTSDVEFIPALASVPQARRRKVLSDAQRHLLKHDRDYRWAFVGYHLAIMVVLGAMVPVYAAGNGTGLFVTKIYPFLAVTLFMIFALMHHRLQCRKIHELLLRQQQDP